MKQISVFIENAKGKLASVTNLLAQNNIDLRALSIADTTDYGILRIIVEDPISTNNLLLENGYLTKINDVVGVKIQDKPGNFAKIINVLTDNNIDVEYTYAFTSNTQGQAYIVFRVNDNEHALSALSKAGIATD